MRIGYTALTELKLLSDCQEQRPEQMPALNVLIQINISDEGSKSGIAPATMLQLAEQIAAATRVVFKRLNGHSGAR